MEKGQRLEGKEFLIKTVAQAIPTCVMSCYKLPESVCHEIESLIASFWLGVKNEERKLHWLNWDKMSKAKGVGGLGFRGISDFNLCLLGKHYWRLLSQENLLVGKVLKGRYFSRGTINNCFIEYNPSYAWRSIMGAREVVQQGTRWRIRNREKVKILNDRWIPSNNGFKMLFGANNVEENDRVSDLIDKELGVWKRDALQERFMADEAKKIASIPLSRISNEDKLVWHFEMSGEYSVKSAYHATHKYK